MKKTSKKTVKKAVGRNHTNKKDTVSSTNVKPTTKSLPDISDDSESKNTTPIAIPIAMTEPGKKSQGEISDYSEVIAESVERVRGEFLSDWRKAKITIAFMNITFNMACVNLFPGCQHITIGVDKKKRRLYVEPTVEYDDTSLKFANFKNGRNIPRISTAKFCPYLFDLMKWDPNAKYRILTIYREFGDKKVMIFNLDDGLEVFSETIEENEDGKKKRKTTIYVPKGWEGRFGYRNDELAEKRRLDFSNEVIVFDNKTGEIRGSNIEPKPPTAEELIHEPYGGIRPRKEQEKDD